MISQPLRVLNPRPSQQAAGLSQIIRDAGGTPIEFPTIEIEALATDWLIELPDLQHVEKAIFVSTNAVRAFFTGLRSQHIVWPEKIATYAIGQGTAKALAQYQITALHIPNMADSEHLLMLPSLHDVQQQSILLVTGENSRGLLETTLQQRGAEIQHVMVYRRILPKINAKIADALWQDDAVDIILMLSQEAIANVFLLFGKKAEAWLQSKPWVVISPRLVKTAEAHQVKTVILSPYHEILITLKQLMEEHGRNTQS